jgi:nickel/cobalt exporter
MTDPSQGLTILILTAASLGFIHTLMGPDHYIPFMVIARARRWSFLKTAWVTVLCGVGHILGSVVLGLAGIALGIAVTKLEAVESFRANLAGWALIVFGLLYFVWGIRKALRNRPHSHRHFHEEKDEHTHTHVHHEDHLHVHSGESPGVTPWVLFTIFIFGPCEPLIPILMYPAAQGNFMGVVWVTVVFGAVTILTMTGMVLISSFGITFLPLGRLERYSHAFAGATICLCGFAVQFLGL